MYRPSTKPRTKRAKSPRRRWSLAAPALAQTGREHHGELYEGLRQPGRIGLPEMEVEAIRVGDPWGVDVASGVEAEPGVKDPAKVEAFVAAARGSAVPS